MIGEAAAHIKKRYYYAFWKKALLPGRLSGMAFSTS